DNDARPPRHVAKTRAVIEFAVEPACAAIVHAAAKRAGPGGGRGQTMQPPMLVEIGGAEGVEALFAIQPVIGRENCAARNRADQRHVLNHWPAVTSAHIAQRLQYAQM